MGAAHRRQIHAGKNGRRRPRSLRTQSRRRLALARPHRRRARTASPPKSGKRKVNFAQTLLWPLSVPYGAFAHLRARLYRTGMLHQQRLDGVVISVGNLTTGGTGKTPMVLRIAEHLLTEGKSPAILTRGYRGESGPSGATSDEVRLLQARLGPRVRFGVGADRFARGRALAAEGVDWFVLDDGFQHLQLARDVDILLIDATNPFGGGHVLPAGRLREPRSALARADIIVITRSDHAPAVESVIRRDSRA